MTITTDVKKLIAPIIVDMAKIKATAMSNPLYSKDSESALAKEARNRCVHYVCRNGQFVPDISHHDNKLICDSCGAVIKGDFNECNEAVFDEFLAILNQMVVYGITKGMRHTVLSAIISMKINVPATKTLYKQLTNYVNHSATCESYDQIGSEYVAYDKISTITGI